MGADLILNWVEVPEKPDYDAMRSLIANSSVVVFERLGDEGFRYGEDGAEFWTQCVADLEELVTDGGSRDASILEIGGGRPVLISGGMSWGDMPTETCDLIDHLWAWPELLWAGGFGNSNCRHCNAEIWPRSGGSWVDATDGDGCSDFDAHEPTPSHEEVQP